MAVTAWVLGSGKTWGGALTLPVRGSAALAKSGNFFQPHFSHPQKENKNSTIAWDDSEV